jgi:hypothetical protein
MDWGFLRIEAPKRQPIINLGIGHISLVLFALFLLNACMTELPVFVLEIQTTIQNISRRSSR